MAKLAKPNQSMIRKGLPPKEEEASNNLTHSEVENTGKANPNDSTIEKVDFRPINFKVPNTFRKRFKNFATNNDVTMSELLVTCFEQYEKNLQK